MTSKREAEMRGGLRPLQVSLRAILLAFMPFALALAFPEFGFFAPLAVVFFAMIATLVIIISAIHFVFADDRRAVVVLAWEFIRGLLIAAILALAYLAYAWLVRRS